METQTPFFKPKVVEKAQINIESNTSKQSKKLLSLLGVMALLLVGLLIVYLQVKNDAPKVKIQTETTE